MARKTPGAGGPRLSSFGKKTNDGDSMSPGNMKVPDRLAYKLVGPNDPYNAGMAKRTDVMTGGGPTTAPNDNAGRPDPEVGKKKRGGLFSQRYYRKSTPHPDYEFGNPDSRRPIVDQGAENL